MIERLVMKLVDGRVHEVQERAFHMWRCLLSCRFDERISVMGAVKRAQVNPDPPKKKTKLLKHH